MSSALAVSEYDVGYADGRRDGGIPSPDECDSRMQVATGRETYEDGYVEGYLDRQSDEQQIEFPLMSRIRAWTRSWFQVLL